MGGEKASQLVILTKPKQGCWCCWYWQRSSSPVDPTRCCWSLIGEVWAGGNKRRKRRSLTCSTEGWRRSGSHRLRRRCWRRRFRRWRGWRVVGCWWSLRRRRSTFGFGRGFGRWIRPLIRCEVGHGRLGRSRHCLARFWIWRLLFCLGTGFGLRGLQLCIRTRLAIVCTCKENKNTTIISWIYILYTLWTYMRNAKHFHRYYFYYSLIIINPSVKDIVKNTLFLNFMNFYINIWGRIGILFLMSREYQEWSSGCQNLIRLTRF